MATSWDQYNFYRVLTVDPEAAPEEIKNAYEALTATLNPDAKPEEQKRAAALAFTTAIAALQVLSDKQARATYDSKLKELQQAESEKEKIEAKRAGKLQEQQSIEEDEKLKKAALKSESARTALVDYYYEQILNAAKNSRFETVSPEKLMEWITSERSEMIRKAEQKGRRTSFRIDWQGFASVQDGRKKRAQETTQIINQLMERFHLA